MIENLPDKLKSARIQNNLSRKQVSEKIDISVSMIGLYESGERTPSLSVIIKLAAFYKVSLDYLLGTGTDNGKSLSLEGLTSKQIDALKLTAECFRNLNTQYLN